MTATVTQLLKELKLKKICRFCLIQEPNKLGSIMNSDSRVKASASLPIQIMAIASIEVIEKENMPMWICTDCRILFEHSYRFKQMCKEADMLLRQYPLTGQWPAPLDKPRAPIVPMSNQLPLQPQRKVVNNYSLQTVGRTQQQRPHIAKSNFVGKSANVVSNSPRKLLNSAPVATPEPPVPVRLKTEKKETDATASFLNKVENGEDVSIDDLRMLLSDDGIEELEESSITKSSKDVLPIKTELPNSKPKLLNKPSIRILNKEVAIAREPRLRQPQITRDEDGNVAIVTEIIVPDEPYEREPETDVTKNVEPVETNVFACTQCDRSFPLRQLRDIHMVNHNRERSFKCPDCEKSFFSKYDLQKHSFLHSGVKPFKCSVCEKAFTRAALLHRHEKTHTDIPKFICLYCEKPFISRDEMEKHTERHQKNRPFQCKICNKSFAFKQGLERHELLHSTDLPFPCEYCSMSFFTAGKLARHLTAHAGKRAYPCKFCPKSYLLSHHLSRHMRSHRQGTSPFSCSVCKRVFKNYDLLIEHSTIHATETLQCPLCKEAIDRPENIRKHIQAHTDGDTFACEFCDLIFLSSSQLKAHTVEDHTMEMVPYQDAEPNGSSPEGVELFEDFIAEETDDVVEKPTNCTEEETSEKLNKPKILSQIVIPSQHHKPENAAPPKKIIKFVDKQTKVPATFDVKTEEDEESRTILKRKNPNSNSSPIDLPGTKIIKVESESADKAKAITTVLKSLPKGVSVRRATPKTIAPSADGRQAAIISPESKADTKEQVTASRQTRSSATKSPAATSSTTSPEGENKQPKIHRVTISRKEADAMVKDGRLVMKNGAMVLTRPKANEK